MSDPDTTFIALTGSSSMVPPYQRIRLLLDVPMHGENDPRLQPRRLVLAHAFSSLVAEDAIPLKQLLESKRPARHGNNKRLVRRFKMLATETRNQMLGILKRTRAKALVAERNPQVQKHRLAMEQNVSRVVPLLSKVRFGRAENRGGHDTQFWSTEPEKTRFKVRLVLKSNKKPSKALAAIVAKADRWSMDCSQWVQAVIMLALLRTIGDKAFDTKMASKGPFLFRVQNSTPLTRRVGWERWTSKDQFTRVTPTNAGEPDERGLDEFLRSSPGGTRMAISTSSHGALAKLKSPWWFENTVKTTRKQFAAHGLTNRSVPIYRLTELERLYAVQVARVLGRDLGAVQRSVFVQSIERFSFE